MKKGIQTLSLLTVTLFATGTLPCAADDVTFESSNLPIVIIKTTASINADAKVPGTMSIVNNGTGATNHIGDAPNGYDGPIGIKWRGESSLNFNQKKYTLETRDIAGNDSAVSILGMPAEADWVLLAPYNDVSMVRDVYAYQLWNQMGHWGPRTQMCEVVVNNEYMGVYAFCESIKRDKNRVDIKKLQPEDIAGRDLTGGYIVRIDAFDKDDVTFTSKVKGIQTQPWNWGWGGQQTQAANVTWTIYYPKKDDLQPEQQAYIQSYADSTELAIQSDDFADAEKGYPHFIDMASFVDYFIHTELSLNADGFKRSAYYYKERDKKDGTKGKLFAGPVWDFNLAYGNCNFCNANNVKSWVYEGCETNPTPTMWRRLLEDETFRNSVKRRYTELRQTILSEESIDQFLDSYAELLDQAKDRQLKKYKEVLKSSNPWGWGATSFYAAYQVSSYAEEIATVKKWFRQRLAFLDANLPGKVDGIAPPQAPTYLGLDIKVQGQRAKVVAPQPLSRIDIIDAAGTCLHSQKVARRHDATIDLRPFGNGLHIIVAYTCNGGMVSRSIVH